MAISQVKPSTRWFPNVYSPFADYNYKDGSKPAKEIGPRVDDFESYESAADIPEMDTNQPLWSHYPNGQNSLVHIDTGTVGIDTTFGIMSEHSLTFTGTSDPNENIGPNAGPDDEPTPANPYIQFYTHDESRWQYVREVIDELYGEPWKFNFYNRMAFYVKSPDLDTPTPGTANFDVGTYYSSIVNGPPTSSNAEVGGGNHGYHRYLVTGNCVTKFILDFNPTHMRGANGSIEQPYMEYPIEADAGLYNYFDMLTRLYFDVSGGSFDGMTWNFDNIYFYRENREEEKHNVYSLCASRLPGTNTVNFSFNTDKQRAEGSMYEVRYAFTDIHELGFDNATLWETTGEQGLGGYNMIGLQKTDFDLTQGDTIYIAVRMVGDTLFRQIDLELDLG